LLADEPTGSLDTNTGIEILHLLKQLNEQGRTIILITHDLSVALQAQRIIHILDGRIVN
jgi:putative ABC transport system ATP-binding protein